MIETLLYNSNGNEILSKYIGSYIVLSIITLCTLHVAIIKMCCCITIKTTISHLFHTSLTFLRRSIGLQHHKPCSADQQYLPRFASLPSQFRCDSASFRYQGAWEKWRKATSWVYHLCILIHFLSDTRTRIL